MIYLDNAATSWPKPENVYRVMDDFMRTKAGNPGRGSHSLAVAAGDAVERTRMLAARLIKAAEIIRVIFTLNCTHALNLALRGFLAAGDHVVTSCIEHNSLARPLRQMELGGVGVTRVPISRDTGVTSAGDIEAAVTRDTRLVAVTHASNVNGVVQPVEEYGEVARRHNLLLLVDAAQTAGKYPIDVESARIDLLAFSGHKGLFGPPGVGLLYIGPRAELKCLCEGGTGSYSELEEQPDVLPDKFEIGTANSVGISGLGAGLDFVLSEGVEKIRAHGLSLADRLIEGLSRIRGVALSGVFKKAARVPIVSFVVAGYDPAEAGVILDQFFDIKARTGLHCAPAAHRSLGTFPSGTIRLSPGYFNTLEEIEFTLKAVEKIAASRR